MAMNFVARQRQPEITHFQTQIDAALNSYSAKHDLASLSEALKAQAKLVDALLKLTNLSSPSSVAQRNRIQAL
jgi:hypothetical protein